MLFKAVLCGACSDRAKAAWEHIGRLSKRRAIVSVPDIRSAPCRQARVVARTGEAGRGTPMNAFVAMFFQAALRLPNSCSADWIQGSSDAGLAYLRSLTNVTVSGVVRGNLHGHRQYA